MGINLGDVFPNFEADTTHGKIKFHDWVGKDGFIKEGSKQEVTKVVSICKNGGESWAILFSHPADYTPVCTTELGLADQKKAEFAKRKVKLIALSCDSVEDHKGWAKDIQDFNKGSGEFGFPIIADPKRELATKLGMLDPDEKTKEGLPLTCRAVFIVGPDYKLKLSMLYPATTGRNFDEILRVVDSLQLTMYKKVATPANWKSGEKCMVVPTVKQEEVKDLFPKGVEVRQMPSGKGYMRFTPDPSQ